MDFDTTRLYYSHQQLQPTRGTNGGNQDDADQDGRHPNNNEDYDDDDSNQVDLPACRRHFREFLRNYRLGPRYLYRDRLLRLHRRANSHRSRHRGSGSSTLRTLSVHLSHLGEYDTALMGLVLNQPATLLPTLELAAADALQTLLYENSNNNNNNQENLDEAAAMDVDNNNSNNTTSTTNTSSSGMIQILWTGSVRATPLRQIQSQHMGRLVRCPGIVISTSPVKNRAVVLRIRCHRCHDTQTVTSTAGEGFISLPAVCRNSGTLAGDNNNNHNAGGGNPNTECGRFPYTVVPDESTFVDQQTLKLQEAPETVPTGELPRSVLLTVDRGLVDVAPPGTRVSVLAIPTLLSTGGGGNNNNKNQDSAKAVYLRVVGMERDRSSMASPSSSSFLSLSSSVSFPPAQEEAFRALSQRPDIYDILTRSMAPNLSGSYTVDIKKALICQLMGGVSKQLPDGIRLRGDINVLLLGDPSMAKSQFLKFVSAVAPVGIYTSGKGSSAAGLTASVVRDGKGEFYLEGGAMVLADGGIVCIDEFDKMRPNDRVAIHEAMEQQTISVAKAGITTVLNSRASVLAAANPVYGRYDATKSTHENIDLMTTILSRFDVIFFIHDIRDEARDQAICHHVMGVHMQAAAASNNNNNGNNSSSTNNPFATEGRNAVMSQGAATGGLNDLYQSGSARGLSNASSPEAIAENALHVATTGQGELEIPTLQKYIQYCQARCRPQITAESGRVLESHYVQIRHDVKQQQQQQQQQQTTNAKSGSDQAAIPITVRQLEALVRLSESLARMRLDDQVQREDVMEAIRLFRVSTLAANNPLSGSGGSSSSSSSANDHNPLFFGNNPNLPQQRQEMDRTESFLSSRLVLGNTVNKQRLLEEATGQGFHAALVARALSILIQRGHVLERHQGKLVKRIK